VAAALALAPAALRLGPQGRRGASPDAARAPAPVPAGEALPR
jgi:hypothetical protein